MLTQLSQKDWWNDAERIDRIRSCMLQFDLKGKRVLDLTCRYGLYSYFAHQMGAKSVVGVDWCRQCVEEGQPLVPEVKLYCGNIFKFPSEGYDVILCLGIFYNEPPVRQLKLLDICRKAPVSLLECWIEENGHPYPTTNWHRKQRDRINPDVEEGEAAYQYRPNHAMLQQMLRCKGLQGITLAENRSPNQLDVFYKLTPCEQSHERIWPIKATHWNNVAPVM